MAVDGSGNLFIADTNNNRIRKVPPAGIISTVVGNGMQGYSGDGGPATSATLGPSYAVVVDAFDNLFVADGNNRIRKVTPNGVINTVVGNGGFRFAGDDGAATGAALNRPVGATVDADGNLFVADLLNNRIREVTRTGIIVSFRQTCVTPASPPC